MPIFFVIFLQEILLFWRNSSRVLSGFLFFLISVAIFSLIAQSQQDQAFTSEYLLIIIWFSLLSCLIFSTSEFLKKDFEDGSLEQVMIASENFEIVILAKILASWFANALPILLSALMIFVFSGFDKVFIKKFFLIFLLASLTINFICSFCGSLSVLGNSAAMISIIALPLIIPALLIAHSALLYDFISGLKILSGISVLAAIIAIFAAAKIAKISAE